MKAINIEWDVEHDEDEISLPTEIDIPVGLQDEDDISDYLSDITGYCHKGFTLLEGETKMIGGESCECFEFLDPVYGSTGEMRMELSGSFGEGVNRSDLMLVPLFLEEPVLEAISDMWLTEQEKKLGLPLGESCTSSSWWVGSCDATKDQTITDEYDFLVPLAVAVTERQESVREAIDALYAKKDEIDEELSGEYEGGESGWASQLEAKIEDLERNIVGLEELLSQSELAACGNKIEYTGSYYEVIAIKENKVYLQNVSSDHHMEWSAQRFFSYFSRDTFDGIEAPISVSENDTVDLNRMIERASARMKREAKQSMDDGLMRDISFEKE